MSVSLVSLWTNVRRRLEAAGVDTPVLDARMLIEAGAGVSRLEIVTDPRREMSAEQVAAVEALAARRLAREPISHILGRKGFWTLEFAVTPDVLTPRPDTELLVETALEFLPPEKPAMVLDLGVGTGAILLSVLSERPDVVGVGVDLSEAALAVARANSEALGLNGRVDWRLADWGEGLEGDFDVILSNPPYIATAEIEGLAPEVAHHEPRLALDGGADGLDAYRQLLPRIRAMLATGGRFALEVGKGQAEAVWALIDQAGLQPLDTRADLAGVARVVTGRKREFLLG
ncbi:MAG TPA: peptide chain release factor N(5)-glutamine methyltransferase [Terricaulis sp.]|nr:peptide chain release factor N(5)-glutamine methyltransferase [Terricaulis sp.]